MELSRFTDYSLRVLLFVGVREERSSISEIADAYGISANHLGKVVHKLSNLGLLTTTRGRGGGIVLGRDAAEINVGALVRQTENLGLVECMPGRGGDCCLEPVCKLKVVLMKAQAAFLQELDRHTLADLMEPRSALKELLSPAALPESG